MDHDERPAKPGPRAGPASPKKLHPRPDRYKKGGVRRTLLVLAVLAASAFSCGKPEWVIPKSGEAACMCNIICACSGMSRTGDAQKELDRCGDACGCEPCPGDAPKSAGSSSPAP